MAIYLVLAVSSLLSGVIIYWGKNSAFSKKAYLFFVFVPLIFIAGFRAPSVGTDTASYIQHFRLISGTPWKALAQYNMDFGYAVLNKAVSCFTDNPQILLILLSIITLSGFAIFIYKNSSNVCISTFLFIALYQYCTFFNTMRQYTAVMFICNAYYYLKNRKYSVFILLVCLAALFHMSALIFLPVAFFSIIKPRKIWLGALAVVGCGLIISFKPLLDLFFRIFPQYAWYQSAQGYLEPKGIDENIIIWVVQAILVFLSISLISRKSELSLREHEVKELYLLSAILIISIILNLLTVQVLIAHRLNFYFYIFMIIALPKMIQYWGRYTLALNMTMICCLLLYFYLMLSHNNHEVVPYQMVL